MNRLDLIASRARQLALRFEIGDLPTHLSSRPPPISGVSPPEPAVRRSPSAATRGRERPRRLRTPSPASLQRRESRSLRRSRLVDALSQGSETLTDIGKRLGLSRATVSGAAKRRGFPPRRPGPPPGRETNSPSELAAKHRRANGGTFRAAADLFGAQVANVARAWKRLYGSAS